MTLTSEIWQGALAGLAFGFFNFWLLTRIVRGLVNAESVKKWKTPLYFIVKIGLLALTIVLILKKGYVSPLPFLAGFTVSLIISVTAQALKNSGDKSETSGV